MSSCPLVSKIVDDFSDLAKRGRKYLEICSSSSNSIFPIRTLVDFDCLKLVPFNFVSLLK